MSELKLPPLFTAHGVTHGDTYDATLDVWRVTGGGLAIGITSPDGVVAVDVPVDRWIELAALLLDQAADPAGCGMTAGAVPIGTTEGDLAPMLDAAIGQLGEHIEARARALSAEALEAASLAWGVGDLRKRRFIAELKARIAKLEAERGTAYPTGAEDRL
jgi:uncharacterized small protein (DUF1192 family)